MLQYQYSRLQQYILLLSFHLGPPSCVEELAVTRETNTSVTICWQRPQTLGGRTDLTYHISHREVGTEDPIIDEVEDSGRSRYCHILRNLRPLSQFKIFVETVNSITEQFPNVAATSKGARVKLVIAHTLEGGKHINQFNSA